MAAGGRGEWHRTSGMEQRILNRGITMEPRQTIQQIKDDVPANLLDFLLSLPASFEAQLFYAMLLAGVAGMLTSFILKWAQGQIIACPTQYFFRDNPRGTVLSIIWLLSAVVGSIALGGYLLVPSDPATFIGWGKVMFDGWILGTGGDLGLNKSKRPEWSEAERKEKVGG